MASATSVFRDVAPIVSSVPTLPGLPLLGNVLRFRRDRLALHDDAALVGPIVRVQLLHVPVYVITDADAIHEVLAENAAKFKKTAGIQFLEPLLGAGLLNAEGEVHKRHRKLLAPAFAPKRLAAYAGTMIEETHTQIAKWRPNQQVDLSHEMMELTLAIAGKTMFGADVRREAATVATALELAMRATVASITSPMQLGYNWPLPRHLMMKRAVKMLDEIVFGLIADGRKRGTDRGDVLSAMLLSQDEEGGLDDRQIRDEVMTLFLAGHETTANALTWTFYHLGRNPSARERLEEEVARVLGDRTVTPDDLPNMPWTAAVLDESMRLHPPAYVTGRESTEPVTIGGHQFPARAILLLNIRGVHRRADYFPAPLAFKPERFLPEQKKARPRHHYIPFGAGPRVCIGQHFALLEAQLCLATMVQRARIHPIASSVSPEPLVTLRPKGGLPAIVSPKQ
ncbi:MAG: cytochrome P450 [Kofleriaceae bacterium]